MQAPDRWLTNTRAPTRTPFRLTSARQSNMTRCEYGEVRQVQAGCAGTTIRSIFPSAFSGELRGVMSGRLSNALTAQSRAPFSAFLRLHDGAMMNLSPGVFIQLENGHIQTRPIKRYASRLNDPQGSGSSAGAETGNSVMKIALKI